MGVAKDILYIKADRNVEVTKREVTLGDILSLECTDKAMESKVKVLKILKIPESTKRRYVVSVLRIIECIHRDYPNLEIQNMGEQDVIVTYENQKTPNQFVHFLKTAVVILTTFFGAAFSAMAFNNDVDTPKLFSQIYELLMGNPPRGISILEITYSIGLIIGILVFFNHFGRKKFTVDPTPMEVEMRLYENDIQTTLIENASRKGKELDVGKTIISGGHRS